MKKYIIVAAFVFLVELLLIQGLFYQLQKLSGNQINTNTTEYLLSLSKEGGPQALAIALNSFSNLGTINCAALARTAPQYTVLLDLSRRPDCINNYFLSLRGIATEITVTLSEGEIWRFSFKSKNPTSFYFSLWSIRIIAILATMLIFIGFQNILRKQVDIQRAKSQHSALIATIATQVAHDIRSPLAALNTLEPQMHVLPENTRILVRSAINRIQDIANNLLASNRAQNMGGASQEVAITEKPSVQLITAIIDPLISEKRLQFRHLGQLELVWNLVPEAYGLFAEIQLVEFRRVLSNLINNAVEAFSDHAGQVTVLLGGDDSKIWISVRDNGKGIPAHVLSKLGSRGVSHGKAQGHGLGLAHAKDCAERWKGRLELTSVEAPQKGQGTTVTIHLNRAQNPSWFVSELTLKPGAKVYVLDDDYSIHRIWKGRLDSTIEARHQVVLRTFTQIPDFVNQLKIERPDVCLLDYELAGQSQNGLDVAEALKLGDSNEVLTVLVSSRVEEPAIHERALSLKLKILPKAMVGLVPIEFKSDKITCDAILIDDDSLVRLTWEYSAKNKGKHILCFATPEEFENKSSTFSKNCPIYVDVSLANGVKGDDFAKKLVDQGFTQVFLATGYSADNYKHLNFLKGVVGKDPPWA